MRVVLDTNVIASGLNFPGNERIVLDLARRGRFEWCSSPFILQETVGVLEREFGREGGQMDGVLATLRNRATFLDPDRTPSTIEGNEADNRILACAVEASADYLVTGDRRYLLPLERIMGVRIVNAPVFLNSLEA